MPLIIAESVLMKQWFSWTCQHTSVAAGTHLADGKFLKVTGNREKYLKLRGMTRIPVISKKRRATL